MNWGQIRLRIAPSPTGFPHVGTAFQSLFDFVYAKKHGGKFIIRIEDTDQKRLVAEAEEVIYQSLEWLGILPDESPKVGGPFGPYRQSERLFLYHKYAQELLEQGRAYYCFCSQERLEKMRQDQEKAGLPPKYDRACLALSKEEVEKRLNRGEKAALRMKIPDNETIIVNDLLRGEVKFDSNLLDDQVILKSDGFPTYHLAVVIDDHLMEITHTVRGEEWLPSAPKHVLLYRYLGWPEPKWIHTPILRNPDHSKLSKRHGHTSIEWYRNNGYLPEALINFLGFLVWSHPQDKEIYGIEEMIKSFDFAQMRYLAPIFDLTKLEWINGNWIRNLAAEDLFQRIKEWAEWNLHNKKEDQPEISANSQQILNWISKDRELFLKALKLAQERLKTLAEANESLEFYFEDKLEYDKEDLLQKHEAGEVITALEKAKQVLEKLIVWENEPWEKAVRNLADELGWKHKDLFMVLRSATTARKATPPLFEVMMVLGKEKVFSRIKSAVEYIKGL